MLTLSTSVTAVDYAAIISGQRARSGIKNSGSFSRRISAEDVEGLMDGTYFIVSTGAENDTATIYAAS